MATPDKVHSRQRLRWLLLDLAAVMTKLTPTPPHEDVMRQRWLQTPLVTVFVQMGYPYISATRFILAN
jgi:hypothetical protein